MDTMASPSATTAIAGLTVRRGQRASIAAYRERLIVQRDVRESYLERLDEAVAQAQNAAAQCRRDILNCDAQLVLLDAALAPGGDV